MATILIQTAVAAFGAGGNALAAAVAGFGTALGTAVSQSIFGKERVIEGPRLESSRILSSQDGTPMPRAYGRVRLGSQMIWATRFEEETTRERHRGGKGSGSGTTVERHRYYANFAVGICEGPIASVLRIWADGRELDRTKFTIRVHEGAEDENPDPLIEAKQGSDSAPAFRGTAYVVFERFELTDFGNRIPQLNFEVLRPVSRLAPSVKAISVIPGSTEYAYDPEPVLDEETRIPVNRSVSTHSSDWSASLDELQSCCPNLERVSLVVAWFGDDLRASHCRIEPRVVHSSGPNWSVAGVTRSNAKLVSRQDGNPAYGGTPDDASVIRAIRDVKKRGLKAWLNPFLMMDIPEGNELPDPYGRDRQPAYPWRGRITCDPAPGSPDTVDLSASASAQLEQFFGSGEREGEWRYRRMMLHYARLAKEAGGVDGFLIGSEMKGLSQVRGSDESSAFVEPLSRLLAEVREILGPDVSLTYGADWSEYFGHHPRGEGEGTYFHLDPLWSDSNVDAVGIDNYMPLSDWRTGGDPGSPEVHSPRDPSYLKASIAGGEGHEWHYPSEDDRREARRSPIADGEGEPWRFRYKDLSSWWSLRHRDRLAGGGSRPPTEWVPRSKPIWFTELGCPAVASGANQPNVFFDPKSSESSLPRFSSGARDDLAQNRFLTAHRDHWDDEANNPSSSAYGGRMVDWSRTFLWAWDARPFPRFPLDSEQWSDGPNWSVGHWLNGRLSGCPAADLIEAIAEDFGIDLSAECDGFVEGYWISGPVSARDALEPLLELVGAVRVESGARHRIVSKAYAKGVEIERGDLAMEGDQPRLRLRREPEHEAPLQFSIRHASVFRDYQEENTQSRRLESRSRRHGSLRVPACLSKPEAEGLAEARLRDQWIGRETMEIGLSHRYAALGAGDVLSLSGDNRLWRIEAVEDGEYRRFRLRAVERFEESPLPVASGAEGISRVAEYGRPEWILMNLPLDPEGDRPSIYSALSASPWARNYAILSSPRREDGFLPRLSTLRRASVGKLASSLSAGPEGRWDRLSKLEVFAEHGTFSSLAEEQVLNSRNAAAVLCENGEWEILQFSRADLLSSGGWLLSDLLRAQFGTERAMRSGAEKGTDFVFLDHGVERIELQPAESGLTLHWRAGPASHSVGDETMKALTHAHLDLGRRPLSPVRLRAERLGNGDVSLSWIRRSRIGADDWEAEEIPLGEENERYRIHIAPPDGEVVRTFESERSEALYSASDQRIDFNGLASGFRFSVEQIGSGGHSGTPRWAMARL